MPHAIVVYFDTTSNTAIRNVWKELAEADVCDYLYRSENDPHIKLGMYDGLDVEKAKQRLSYLASNSEMQKIHFKNIGVYPGEKRIVFLDISATMAILELKQKVQSLFDDESQEIGANYFLAGIWKPDCFLTMSIEREKLPRAIDVTMNLPLPFDGFIEQIGVIEFHPARKLFSFPLCIQPTYYTNEV
jgi:hypothetical protein